MMKKLHNAKFNKIVFGIKILPKTVLVYISGICIVYLIYGYTIVAKKMNITE